MSAVASGRDRDWAIEQDRRDPLRSCRELFERPRQLGEDPVYLAGNSLGLMPKAARDRIEQELSDWAGLGVEGHHLAERPWYSYHENFREMAARLVGAQGNEVVMMNSLTVNLHLMMVSFYRPTRTRYKVLIEDAAFPSDIYAVQSHVEARGYSAADAVLVARPAGAGPGLDFQDIHRILEVQGDQIALVLLPGVQYFTGQRFEIEAITQAAHAVGALVGFDLAHAVGNVPLALHDWNVDFAVWCSYKYLNGGPGAIAGCFVHQRHGLDPTVPRFAGWWGNDPSTRFRMHLNERFVPRPGADGWQLSNPPIMAMAPLLESLRVFDRIGMPALRQKSQALTGYLESLVEGLDSPIYELLTPRDPAARGAQLSFRVRERPTAIFEAVRAQGIIPDFRQPDVIRLAPVPLYNSFEDVWRAAAALDQAANA